MLLGSEHSWTSHFIHHPEPTYTPAKEWLYPLFKDLRVPNKIHHLLIYGIYKEYFAHHCNSAASGMKEVF